MSVPALARSSNRSRGRETIRWQCRGRSVTGRIDSTTTGPTVSGGTKCASMTSTWIMSAYGSTAFICSPRRAKSAERMDAASFPGVTSAAILPRSPILASEPGHEHGVCVVPVGPQTDFGGLLPIRPPEGVWTEPRDPPHQGPAGRLGLRTGEGADRVHEDPPRTE